MAPAMEIELPGYRGKFIGIRNGNIGTFKHEDGDLYIGQIDVERKCADGLGVLKDTDGSTRSGRCADGRQHGHWLGRWADGTMRYFEHDTTLRNGCTMRHLAVELMNGTFFFDGQPCAATDARFLELKLGALDVEVYPALRRAPPILFIAGMWPPLLRAGSRHGVRAQDRGARPVAPHIAARAHIGYTLKGGGRAVVHALTCVNPGSVRPDNSTDGTGWFALW